MAESQLVKLYVAGKLTGRDRLKRQRILRWAILQHYGVCRTPLLDVTHSLRIAASFATQNTKGSDAFVFVLGVPHLSGAVTASSEASLQIVRLSSACPPEAVRSHLQEGYLLGEYPEIPDFAQNEHYKYSEMDFGRRLIAKFRLRCKTFWKSPNFSPATLGALFPSDRHDQLFELTKAIHDTLTPVP